MDLTPLGREILLSLPGPRREIMAPEAIHFTYRADDEVVRANPYYFFLRSGFRPRARASERVIELPAVWQALPPAPATILDVGPGSSLFPIQLASLGYRTHVIDVRPYRYSHPGLTIHVGDIREFRHTPFEVITCISTLEHIGLGAYGERPEDQGISAAMDSFRRLLQVGGRLIVTVPYGAQGDPTGRFGYRLIDDTGLTEIVRGWDIVDQRFFRIERGSWMVDSAETVRRRSRHRRFPGGAAVTVLTRD